MPQTLLPKPLATGHGTLAAGALFLNKTSGGDEAGRYTRAQRARGGAGQRRSNGKCWRSVDPVAGNDEELADFLSHWIDLKQRDGTIDRIADHWLYGKTSTRQGPRWSIIRDVLHWVE